MPQTNHPSDLVSVSVRVPRATAERLKQIADSEFRPIAAHVRSLILQDIQRVDSELEDVAA